MGAPNASGLTRIALKLKDRFAAKVHNHAASDINSGTLDDARIPSLDASKIGSGTLGVARGGTGASTHTANAVLTGNGTSAVNNVATASGALYATAANGAAQFGTLPVAQGGTGATTAAGAAANIVDGQAIEPASVAATGEVSAKSGTGASAVTHNLTDKAEDSRADNLEASIAYVESTTARTNHASGDYFMLGDVLMKATAAIATGEQITTSNATPATVQGQIDTLRDSVSPESWYSGAPYHIAAMRVGRIVTLTVITDPINGAGIGVNTTIATLPQGWRPPYNVSATCMAGGVYDMTLYTDGSLNIWSLDIQGAYVRGNLTYVTSG